MEKVNIEGVITEKPKATLLSYTDKPYDLAIASARTCYSSRVIGVDEIEERHREHIGVGIFEAGHHTPFQHPTFVFSLENVSRQFVWSFLHSHTYYNSEQTSQRYVVHRQPKVFIPPLEEKQLEVYNKAVIDAWHAYDKISDMLIENNKKYVGAIGKIKGQSEKKINLESEKKAIESARYVLPIASFTQLYHTVSGITLQRYIRMAESCDCPYEAKVIVNQMADQVRAIDPDFLERVPLESIPVEEQPEQAFGSAENTAFHQDFDERLGERVSVLVNHTENGEEVVAENVRIVLGKTKQELSDDDAIDLVMNPAKNKYLLDTLNTWTHSPLMRTLQSVNYTFYKKMSHGIDSQEQRHRTTPGGRPLLTKTHTKNPDFITPKIITENEEAITLYEETMQMLWDVKNKLIEMGVSEEFAVYILPNAVSIRYSQTGNLLGFMHKWRLRTCFLAQMEVFDAAMDELEQAREVHPRLTKYIGPPCFFRNGLVEDKPLEGPCPEGDHWCGISVWRGFPKIKRKI